MTKSESKSRKPPSAEAQLRWRASEPSRQSRIRFRNQKIIAGREAVGEMEVEKQERRPEMKAARVMCPGVMELGM